MSKLSYLEKLMDDCAVEWKPLWEVTIWDKRFNAVDRRKQPKVMDYTYLLAAELFKLERDNGNVFLLSTGARTGWTTEELAGENLREGEVVTIPWGKSRPVKDVLKYYKGRFVTADNRIATSNDTNKLLNKFLYYWMMSQSEVIDTFYRGAGIQHPSMSAVLDMNIPIPPLPIQTEIVRILDAFTALTAELAAELTARKKQYNYYRDRLLTFAEGEAEWKPLSDIVRTVTAPAKLKREAYREVGKIPIVDQGANYIAGYTDEDVQHLTCDQYIIFGDHSEHVKYVDFAFIQGADGLKILKPILDKPKYVYYALQNFYQKELNYKRHWSRARETLMTRPL